MANRQKDRDYVTASKMKLLFSLILLASGIIVDVPHAQALTVCPVGNPCYKNKPKSCPKGQIPVFEKSCGWECCAHRD